MAAAVMALGSFQLPRAASADVFPEFAPTQVQIQTEAPGPSAAEVEQLITVPLEQDLLNGVAWLDEITSESAPGLSSVDLVFGPGTDEQKARQAVQERLVQVGGLPQVGKPPVMIQHVLPITKAQDPASVAVEDTTDKRLRIGDVASVVEDHQPLIGDVTLSDGPGITLVIEKYPDANTREVTHAVEEAMTSLQPGLSGITVDTHVYRPASFVDTALDNVGLWALVAVTAVSALLGLYFLSWRVALISLVSITLAEIAALWVLYLRGSSFNMMVLAGLTIALGAVIDDMSSDSTASRDSSGARTGHPTNAARWPTSWSTPRRRYGSPPSSPR
ncbi:efflux RND transporter permease subunit [Streptomyces litmocidini]|uniref:efflux RND transporter permease subunit n=1 Tax=Streptomyces litmocidini TaxID=67318 RepID=UPI0037032A42